MGLSSNAVQFKGIETVLKAYENRGVEFWSIWQNKQFMFKGAGDADLREILTMLTNGGTNATYTLRIFEDVKNVNEIKGNTADDGSFNFRLDSVGMDSYYVSPVQSPTSIILEKLSGIEKRLEEVETGEPENKSLGRLGEILEHPTIAAILPGLIEKLTGALFDTKQPQQPPQNVIQMPPARIAGIEEDNQVIIECITILKKHDPDIILHLQKLVQLAESNPALFKGLISSL
jgi:hypothetical protein